MERCEVIQSMYRYIYITHDMLYKPNIIFYHSNVKNKIDKKYDNEFKDLTRYYKKYTKKPFNEFDYKKGKTYSRYI